MKRFLLVYIILSLSFSLMGCMRNKSGNDESMKDTTSPQGDMDVSEEAPLQPENDISEQIHLIVDNADLWKVDDETDWWGYAVTDIDKNGRIEIISSQCHGSGHFTSTQIWEVDDNIDNLVLCKQDEDCGPVIMPQFVLSAELQSVPVYYDSNQSRCYYIFDDLVNDGAKGYYENKRAISLREGSVTGAFLAYKDTIYSDNGENATYQDADGNAISEDEYKNIADQYFDGLEKYQAKIQWIEDIYIADISENEIYTMIENSYDAFIIK